LSHDERKDAISFTRKTLNDNGFKHVLVIAGTGAQSTRETINLCCDAKEAGATHALVLTPSTWVPAMTREAIIRFHTTVSRDPGFISKFYALIKTQKVADNSPIPTMIYNFPTVTAGQNLTSDVISELAQHPNIVGTKLSCGDVGKLTRLSTVYGTDTPGAKQYGEFATFPGKSDVLLPGLLMKSHGLIGALVNLAPKAHVKVVELFDKGDLAEAVRLQQILSQADAAASAIGGIGGLKACCAEYFGYGEGNVRGPLMNVSKDKVVQGAAADLVRRCVDLEKSL
jgi:4-hydroxy-2-oxoglutarate aldolase